MSEQDSNQNASIEQPIEINETRSKTKPALEDNYRNPIFILTAIMTLLLLLILILHYPSKPKLITWEYKTLKFNNQGNDRSGSGAGHYETILISQDNLNELGKDGWELVTSYLEMETAYPNFGNSSYVTGIQPNVRPQGLICIFKKPLVAK